MDADLLGIAVTLAIAVVGGGWTLWKWHSDRRDDRRQERQRLDSLYVNPLLFAAEEVQSRLYNILDRGGLGPLRATASRERYPVETLYLIARYFAYEVQMLRFTALAADPAVISCTPRVRDVLATASSVEDVDPWCLFRTVQTALGQSVIEWRQGEVGFADTVSLVAFEDSLTRGLASRLGLEDALSALGDAESPDALPKRSLRRLADLQSELVLLLEVIEERSTTDAAHPFTVAPGLKRLQSQYRTQAVEPAVPVA